MKHSRLIPWVLIAAVALLVAAPPATAADIKEKEIGPKAKGKLYEWHSEDGLAYHYRLPKDYDPEEGANLTVILHGSNLTRGWGFANHVWKTFRPDDIVVSPDGTTSNGRNGFNFLGERKDAKRFHTFLNELKQVLKIQKTYLYGHSQGSFFALYYAGEYPEDVDGIVAHASGVWTWTQQGPKGHHQAIVLMHGTQDPVVPYPQSVGGFTSYQEKKYPLLRLRSLENWNHWPAEENGPVPHTSQQLTWCEGMTTDDPKRLEACLAYLMDNKSKERHDYAGLRSVANRIAEMENAPEKLRKEAAKARTAVDALAAAHVAALEIPDKAKFDGEAWIGHLPVFLRSFQGVPSADVVAEEWEKVLAKHQKDGVKHLRKFWPAMRKGDIKDAFSEGLEAIEKGFLYYECWDREFLGALAKWRKEADDHKLSKRDLKKYDQLIKEFEKAREDGYKAFDRINSKAKL